MKKKSVILTIILAISVVFLSFSASNPIVSYRGNIPENHITAIERQAKGIYSKKLPLVPVYVDVNNFESECVYYTIYYFPFGTVDMSYNKTDGYNIEKPLTSLN